MKKIVLILTKILVGLYLTICGILYFYQENFIFFPQKLDKNHKFEYRENFEELTFKSNDGKNLNGLLFKADNSKGLIFYLHGNSGSLKTWGNISKTYTDLNYDIFILDYRSFGKSEGELNGQEQLFLDNQSVYNELKSKYQEGEIIIIGYSIGTGLAAKLASDNNPKQLILKAPYYNLIDMMKQKFSFVPTFLLKYKFETNEYLKNCNFPITIFHGNQDYVINYNSSVKLKKEFKNKINLITLDNQRHNGIGNNPDYRKEIKIILSK